MHNGVVPNVLVETDARGTNISHMRDHEPAKPPRSKPHVEFPAVAPPAFRDEVVDVLRWASVPLKQGWSGLQRLRHVRRRKSLLRGYFAEPGFKGLNIGCGPSPMPGWLNTDLLLDRLPWRAPSENEKHFDFPLDITRQLPLHDDSLDAIYGEEVIEHIPLERALYFFREAKRALRPGGTLRMTTPDLDGVLALASNTVEDADIENYRQVWLEPVWSREVWTNAMFHYWGHQFLWSRPYMERALLDAGFTSVTFPARHQTDSGLNELSGIESREPQMPELEGYFKAFCMIVEARA